MNKEKTKQINKLRRHRRIRAKIQGTSKIPRVSICRSNKNIRIQFIDDTVGKTLLSNSFKSNPKTKGTKTDLAGKIGETMASKAKEAGIKQVKFDRGGFKYHGRIKAFAEGLRNGGIKF